MEKQFPEIYFMQQKSFSENKECFNIFTDCENKAKPLKKIKI